ncbi:MAG: GAF domain-containing protein [Chamaesiphon sp.]|nr:GAF domain-containing protein [Chamaesiphon sp.]
MLNPIPLLTQSESIAVIVPDPLVVTPDTTVMAVIARMNSLHAGSSTETEIDDLTHRQRLERVHSQARSSCVLIIEDGRLLGMLTERDVVRLIAEQRDLANLAIRDVMKSNVVTVRASAVTDLAAAIGLLDRHQIRYLPVIEDALGEMRQGYGVVGILTHESLQHDLAAALTTKAERQNVQLESVENVDGCKQVKLDLSESQQFLQTVFNTFPLAVFWKDRESRFLGCNQNFARDANLNSPSEIIGKTDYDLPWGAFEADAYRADDLQVIDSGMAKLGIIETQTRSDGSSIWIETNKLPLRNLAGETIGIIGTYQDITDRKHTETQLHRLSERLSLSLKSGAFGCWELDIVKDSLIWDERMYELYGLQPAQLDTDRTQAYQTWIEAIHPDDRAAAKERLEQALLGQVEFNPEFRVIHPDGSIHFIKAHGLVQRDERDRPYRMIGINFDISAAKRDEAIRQQTEATIRQQAEREFVLREMTQRIRKSLELPTIFETAVREIREFMRTDRVGIFKFNSDFDFDEGEFLAESVSDEFESILGAQIHDPYFAEKLVQYYQQDKINAVEDIHTAGLLDGEVRVLAKFQVRANLVIPLFNGSALWGLLCIHHCAAPRSWQASEIDFIKHIAEQIGIAIQQATLYEKVQLELSVRWRAEESIALQLRQQTTVGAIAQQIRNSLRVEEILATATAQVKELMKVDRVTIFQVFSVNGDSPMQNQKIRAVEEVVSPKYPSLVEMKWEREPFSKEEIEFYLQGQPRIVVDVMQDTWSLRVPKHAVMAQVKSKIVAPILLQSGDSETDTWIDNRGQIQLWGLLSVHSCSSHRYWQDAEARSLQQIADQLAIAIQQAGLFEQLEQELAERKQVETQLRQSNQQLAVSNRELARTTRLKDEFLANMSHELRTPLNAILGMSEGLQDGIFGVINDRQHKSISLIEKSGKHLLALISDILDLSKMEANKFKLELSDISVQDLCQNSVLFIKELALKKQIRLNTQLPDYLKRINIQVDDRRCRQVLINLLSNAVKFTPEGGTITLDIRVIREQGIPLVVKNDPPSGSSATPLERHHSSHQPPCQIAFSITDTGIGIAPENMSKLFESFVQIDSSLSRQYAGTGLGLALVKRIVEMHGGTVSVQSELERGSCFRVLLPFCPSAEIAVPSSLPPLVYPPLATPREPLAIEPKALVLVVEDNQANMETMTGYLKSRGYRLMEAINGRIAIDLAKLHHPDIILMDIQMPAMDGFAAISQIRQIPECATIPIVALTALAMAGDLQKCLDAGASHYVTKPVKLSQLVVTIATLLNPISVT